MNYFKAILNGQEYAFVWFSDDRSESVLVMPEESIEYNDGEGEDCINWKHYKYDSHVNLQEIERPEFVNAFVRTRNFLNNKI